MIPHISLPLLKHLARLFRLLLESRKATGRVGMCERSRAPLLLASWIFWFGESTVLTLTGPDRIAVAVMLFSQLTGPEKRTLHGFGVGLPGHVATCLVTLQPDAARTPTWTGSSLTCRVSMLTA